MASAHTRSQSFSSWSVDEGRVRLTFTIGSSEAANLLRIDVKSDLEIALVAYLSSRIDVAAGGSKCRAVAEPRVLAGRANRIRVRWHYACPPDVSIEIGNDAFFDEASSHVHFARVRAAGGPPVEYVFTGAERRQVIAQGGKANAESGTSFGAYLALGVEHILIGLDHIAFLLALLLLCRRLRNVAIMVTGFTLSHTITLTIAVLGVVEPKLPVIEALIGFTIALVAAENIGATTGSSRTIAIASGIALVALALLELFGGIGLPALTLFGLALFTVCYLQLARTQEAAARLRPMLTVLFGLIHGFGFASVLLESGLPTGRLAAALFGFNLGVEIGKLAIVGTLYFVGVLLARRFASLEIRLAFDATSAALCALGVYWFVQRSYSL